MLSAHLTSVHQRLCQVLTQRTVRARILGRSEAPELPANVMVTATGNNLALLADMTRRFLLCRLDPQCERPELRQFERDAIAFSTERRPRLVAAALTVLRAYHAAGRPEQERAFGGYEGRHHTRPSRSPDVAAWGCDGGGRDWP